MKVFLDTSVLAVTQTGVGSYVANLLAALKGVSGLAVAEMAYRPVFSRKTSLRAVDTLLREMFWYDKVLAKKAGRMGADLIHCPAFNFPVRSKANLLITVHDVYAFVKPSDLPGWHGASSRYFISEAVNQQRHVLVPAAFTKKEILSRFPKAEPSNVHVIHSGISPRRHRQADRESFIGVAKRYSLDAPYLLSVSTVEPRKNFNGLLHAFASIKEKIPHTLVIVGANGWKNRSTYNLIKALGLEKRVSFTGFVPEGDLNVLYSNASCFVFPSLYEGFGFTPLEAMKCGCPVASSDASCMPEILENAPEYFTPHDPDAMAAAVLSLLTDDDRRKRAVEAGIAQAAKFCWSKTAEATAALYQRLA